ncbi:hypothetical protein F383_28752 [Gossypium arboreum]|uniref:Uncharacterized protein n=1 Tax=Gossypium arboreum TaxID=29729 RepID=A0A0B0MTH3_GOSAR|nr:hypothetical protein F383_28752 [Gossypium arboreum]
MPKNPENWPFLNWTKLGSAGTCPCDTPSCFDSAKLTWPCDLPV